MVRLIEGNYHIDHSDFEELTNQGSWIITKRMKENWDEQRHYDYLFELHDTKVELCVEYVIDSSSLKQANKIDIRITSMTDDPENQPSPKHIRFIKL